MLLKRLELQGFKSFADKTVLDLNHNVVAVVGPNGSGKSNVTDAIRWLLGERDARNLRGGKVEDLIFAGTEKKARLGMAQATLVFDNSAGLLPVETAEVSISRRVSRDGESQFFINKAEVRLKDVIDFFAKAKLGARGLTIITQGSSDMFIKAAPVERREMIEEILGLKEYELKKSEALRRLKNTGINLETVMASLEELKPHLKFLKKQVARYEGREMLAQELAELEKNFYGLRYAVFENELRVLYEKRKNIESEAAKEEKIYKELERAFAKVKASQPALVKNAAGQPDVFNEIDIKRKELTGRRANLQKELGKIEARLEFESTKPGNLDINLKVVLKEIKDLAQEAIIEFDLDSIRRRVRAIIEYVDNFSKPKNVVNKKAAPDLSDVNSKISDELKQIDEELKILAKSEEETRAGLSNFNKDFTTAYEAAEAARLKLNAVLEEKSRIGFEIEKVNLKIANLKEELRQIGRRVEDLGTVPDPSFVEASEGSSDEVLRRMFKLRGELSAIGEVDQNLIKEAKETEDRFNFLTAQVNDLEMAMRDLKILIKDLDNKIHNDFKTAIHKINDEFLKLMRLMFGGGTAKLVIEEVREAKSETGGDDEPTVPVSSAKAIPATEALEDNDILRGIEIELTLPKKRIKGLDVLSGGERTLVSIAVLFALISVSPPPFLVLDEVDAALDEGNARRISETIKEFSNNTQFVIITHNRATMEAANVLYGVTMNTDGTSKILSLKLEDAKEVAKE